MMAFDIPSFLYDNAFRASNGEFAWPKREAIAVVDWAREHKIAVYGVEIWLPTTPGPTIPAPFIYAHANEPSPSENWAAFVARANQQARDYIEHFSWEANDHQHDQVTPYFNLTLSDAVD